MTWDYGLPGGRCRHAPVIMLAEKAADLLRAVPAPPRQRTASAAPDRARA